MTPARSVTGGTLAAIGVLHLAWAAGSTWPYGDERELADQVAGTDQFPGRTASVAVAGALVTAASLVADLAPVSPRLRRIGVCGVGTVLAVRGVAGVTASTGRLVGWSTSATFDRNDRRWFGPLCLALSLGALASLRD